MNSSAFSLDLQAKWKILVVDDEEDLCDIVASQFERAGCETLTAYNSESAYAAICDGSVDALILDVRLPGGNSKRLIEKSMELRVKVFMMSGLSELALKDAAAKGNARAYFLKPFNFNEMIRTVLGTLQSEPASL